MAKRIVSSYYNVSGLKKEIQIVSTLSTYLDILSHSDNCSVNENYSWLLTRIWHAPDIESITSLQNSVPTAAFYKTMSLDNGDSHSPYNFSWIVQNELAGMGWPRTIANLNFLVQQGIRHLVTLSPEMIPPIKSYPQLQWTLIPVEEFEAPSMEDINKFIAICEQSRKRNEAVGVHCRMGRGRTGVMAACYLVHFQGVAPERAIINIRLQRPGSVETTEQERAVIHYRDQLRTSGKLNINENGKSDSEL